MFARSYYDYRLQKKKKKTEQYQKMLRRNPSSVLKADKTLAIFLWFAAHEACAYRYIKLIGFMFLRIQFIPQFFVQLHLLVTLHRDTFNGSQQKNVKDGVAHPEDPPPEDVLARQPGLPQWKYAATQLVHCKNSANERFLFQEVPITLQESDLIIQCVVDYINRWYAYNHWRSTS